ncbi:MAG: glycosyltransferase [bacterium]
MKISIIIPVYNERETIRACLEALLKQEYRKEDYEIIVVNDCSTDDTRKIVEGCPVRRINLEENSGRVIARERGAEAASFDNLLFLDARVIASGDLLKKIGEIGYQPLMAGEQGEDKYRSPFDTLFYLIRKKVYAPYYPQRDWGKELWIDRDNFDRAPKGTTCFFCSRKLFLESIPDIKGKTVNDDTRLLETMVKKTRLLRHTDLRITYLQRTGWKTVLRHIYERGPRFADYYLNRSSRYSSWWRIGVTATAVFLAAAFYYPFLWRYWLLVPVGLAGTGLFLAENLKDFAIVLIYSPPIILAFTAGIIKGKYLSLFSHHK